MRLQKPLLKYASGNLAASILTVTLLIAASQAQTLKVIHAFTGGRDGANPFTGLTIDSAGDLYGVAGAGGGGTCVLEGTPGCGSIFKLTPKTGGGWTFTALYNFLSEPDGAAPIETVTLLSNGTLVGITVAGGEGDPSLCTFENDDIGCGTVWELAAGSHHDKVLYRFQNGTDGGAPYGNVIQVGKNFYGVTVQGGDLSCNNPRGCGTVYEMTPTGAETAIHAFTGAGGDGANPIGGLVADKNGNLYGTTAGGGLGYGTIYELSPQVSGIWRERILYSFTNTGDGENPNAGLAMDNAGNLYGTTWQGGAGGGGTVFKLPKNSRTLAVLYSFPLAGFAVDPLVLDSNNNIYGTIQGGGANGLGEAFELKPNGTGYSFIDLHDFTGLGDGGNPLGGLVLDSAGNLYGTTLHYGANNCGDGAGCGVVYEITP